MASRGDWATGEETSTKIVAAIEVEVSIRTAILLWSIGGATPLMAFLFSSCSNVRRNVKRLHNLPSSNGEDTGLSILLYGFKSRWEESRLVTVCGCEAAGIPAKVCRLGY